MNIIIHKGNDIDISNIQDVVMSNPALPKIEEKGNNTTYFQGELFGSPTLIKIKPRKKAKSTLLSDSVNTPVPEKKDTNTKESITVSTPVPEKKDTPKSLKEIIESNNRKFNNKRDHVVINVNRYASEQIDQIKQHLFSSGNFTMLKGGCGIGKTTLIKELFKDTPVILPLPRTLNIDEQKEKDFKDFTAIYTENDNFDEAYSSDRILCTHKGLMTVLREKRNNNIVVVIDEFHSLISNTGERLHDELLNYLKDNNIKTLFISATFYDAHKKLYNSNIIEIQSEYLKKAKEKQDITIYHYKGISNKTSVKTDFIHDKINEAKKRNNTLFVWIENKDKIKEKVDYYNNTGFNAIGLSAHIEGKEREEIINKITGENIPYDIVFFTSTLEAGVNIIDKNIEILISDNFISYSSKYKANNILNPLRTEQVIGRGRKFPKTHIYIDFDRPSQKANTLDYNSWKDKYVEIDWSLLDRSSKDMHSSITSLPDHYILENKYGKLYYSETKMFNSYLDYKHSRLSIDDLAEYINANVIEYKPPYININPRSNFEGLKSGEFKDVLKWFLAFDYDALMTRLVQLKIVQHKKDLYTPVYTINSEENKLNEYFNDHCLQYKSMIKMLLHDFKLFKQSNQFTNSELYGILNLHDEHLRIAKIRVKAGNLNDLYNNNPHKIKDSIRKSDITKLKKFGERLKGFLKHGSCDIMKALDMIHQDVSYTITAKQMIDVLSIFYNVEYSTKKRNSIYKLRTVTKQDRYFLRYEYNNDGLRVSLDDNEDKPVKITKNLKTEKDYKKELESLKDFYENILE